MKPIVTALVLSLVPSLAMADEGELEKAQSLAHSLNRSELQTAVEIYEKLLKKRPEDFELLLGTATAMNNLMSVATHQNLPFIEDGDLELADSSRNKKLWKKWGEPANAYAKKALDQRPKDIRAAFAYANSYMYVSSSMGIVSAILDGAASTYEDNAKRLIALDPQFEDGVGYFFLAAFYLVAPWPMSDRDETRAYLKRALGVSKNSVRNHYLLGVLEFEEENWDASEREFQFVVARPCSGSAEKQVCGFLKKRAKLALKEIQQERE
ncbi:MAG: hypothetical protein AAFQ82_05055 [Myxococcota bacterium]